ncbi:GntR family transcriptional regulator [Zavarzinia compransoris]|uniref:GntR family transcriptional regulator n=1 Tax=Zavarzinia marina TaxID=2911065 RepID=UPI001F171E33|nr:GntR family transcriptional regulator [Zavarzinia marina]MCF4166508.1 GntR family transcriptional regulator [Zavarzinia marina]
MSTTTVTDSADKTRRKTGPRKSATRSEELRLVIADEIVQGRLSPGTPLEELEVARRFGVSRTPVREAIRELAASGLVETRPHRSALVALPSLDRLRGMFEVMAELEAICAGLAAVNMTGAERRNLEALHETLGELVRQGDPQRYHEVNENFHSAIYHGSHNDYLTEITLATRARLSPFRRAQFRTLGRLSLSHAEHDRVVTAILRGEKTAAEAAMRGHITVVEETYERYSGAR